MRNSVRNDESRRRLPAAFLCGAKEGTYDESRNKSIEERIYYTKIDKEAVKGDHTKIR